ncbi:expressed protein [Echinococcus multilocularis]|uniref:Expressed protein n=1 Tax=Echinococcus multilocularis TaxID=6211 RepID=A0A068YEX2_ECHMU|nr:expressed protein [Echinococcus multilocularis]
MHTSTSHLKAVPTYCLEFTFNCVDPAWLLRPCNRYVFYLRLGFRVAIWEGVGGFEDSFTLDNFAMFVGPIAAVAQSMV